MEPGKFHVPTEVKKEWEEIGKKGQKERLSWESDFALLSLKNSQSSRECTQWKYQKHSAEQLTGSKNQ
jgi:transketolase